MRATVDKSRFFSGVSVIGRVVGKKESLPVLSCILIEARKGELVLRATNLESALEIHVPAKVEEVGVCAVPATILTQTTRLCRGAQISLAHNEKKLITTSGGSTTTIHTIPHEEFPHITHTKDKNTFTIPRTAFINGIRSVAYAASPSTIRQEFGCIYITYKNNALVFVATDSFRLAEKKINTPTKKQPDDVLIPIKNALDAAASFETQTEEEVEFSIADSQLQAICGETIFASRVVDAVFPNYEAIIPKKTTTEAVVLKEDLAATLQKANLFSGEQRQIGFHIYPHKKILSTTAQHAVVGDMSDAVDAALSGEDIDINFNTNLIADCIQSIHTDSVALKFSGAGKPLIIQGIGDNTFTYLVMPLNK